MKIETFYRKYANIPTEKRFIGYLVIGYLANEKGLATSFSLSDLYKQIRLEDDKRRVAVVEIERLLKIADEVMN